MTEHTVPRGVSAMPLKRYLARAYPLLPGRVLDDALKRRDVRVNGARALGADTVRAGDVLRLYLPDIYLTGELPILYHGEGLLAVEKPARLPVDVDQDGVGADTVLSRAQKIDPNARLCHRLDVGTGGVMLLATDREAERTLTEAFRAHALEKRYACLVRGCPAREQMVLTHYLRKDEQGAFVHAYDKPVPGASKAVLHYRVIERRGDTSRLAVKLMTGRTHQIRVQLSAVDHPLVGDDKYGDRAFNKAQGASWPALWCVSMTYAGRTFKSNPPF